MVVHDKDAAHLASHLPPATPGAIVSQLPEKGWRVGRTAARSGRFTHVRPFVAIARRARSYGSDMREIVVVCYGNICRSPMGEVLLQRALDERLGEGAILV
ncbi:MAG TPA: hypothetical protein VJ818_00025, partial [Actinomycetota bacterium]|nr:hypothetical protein [Actinomycetota bacterium]